MSLQPLETTARIYEFINEPLSDDLIEVMKIMTNPSEKDIGEHQQPSALETYKNSSEIVNKWKRLTDMVRYNDLPIIESQCRKLFENIEAESSRDGISGATFRRRLEKIDL